MILFSIYEATLIEDFGDTSFYTSFYKSEEKLAPLSHIECKNRLSFKVKPNEDEYVNLSNGKQLRDIDGSIHIYPQVESIEEETLGIGWIRFMAAPDQSVSDVYYPSRPDMYHIEVSLPSSQFSRLVEAAQNGRIPKLISVNARGMELPYESSFKWDIKSSPVLPIASISFTIPLTIGETILNEDTLIEPTQLQVSNLHQEVGVLAAAIQGINKRLQWLLAVMILLVVVLIFKN
jgi:hypothetical protein